MDCLGGYSPLIPRKHYWRSSTDVEDPKSYILQQCINNLGKFLVFFKYKYVQNFDKKKIKKNKFEKYFKIIKNCKNKQNKQKF